MTKTSPIARILAALALAAAVVLVFVVISGSSSDDGGNKGKNNQSKSAKKNSGKKDKQKSNAKTYEVQDGDTLTAIAQKTGISVDKIQELNPELDPQALIAGSKLNLR